MIIERDYQKKAADIGVNSLVSKRKNEIIVAPTGSGKSIIISGICHRLQEPTLVLQPTKEILEQNYNKLISYGIDPGDVGIFSASLNKRITQKYTYATIGSIYTRPELFNAYKYVIIDECHLVNPKSFRNTKTSMYATLFRAMGNPSVLGLTATPYRMVQSYYRDKSSGEVMYAAQIQVLNRIHPFFFKSFAFNITNKTLFDKDYLCPIDYVIKEPDYFSLDKLKINSTGNDFDEEALEFLMCHKKNVQMAVDTILEYDQQVKHNLIFCTSLNHARKLLELLVKFGVKADMVSSKDSMQERDRKIQAFRSGEIRHLLNVGILTTGYDFPALDCITLLRPVLSLGLYYQMVGRGVRKDPLNPNKRCLVLDITDNVLRMGRIETIRIGVEKGGFKNVVESEVGIISGVPLFSFVVKNKKIKENLGLT